MLRSAIAVVSVCLLAGMAAARAITLDAPVLVVADETGAFSYEAVFTAKEAVIVATWAMFPEANVVGGGWIADCFCPPPDDDGCPFDTGEELVIPVDGSLRNPLESGTVTVHVGICDSGGLQVTTTVVPWVSIETVAVGNPGNTDDTHGDGYGGVDYVYEIGKFEVTTGQYTQFLNAVAAMDTYGLYNALMDSEERGCQITQNGTIGSYTYDFSGRPSGTEANWVSRPVNYVSWGDATRFANWLHNGRPTGSQDLTTTEDGSYDLSATHQYYGPDGQLIDPDGLAAALMAVVRKQDATWVIPSEDEWYKAAYHHNDGVTGNYWDYPTKSDTAPTPEAPPGADMTNGSANYNSVVGSPYYRSEVAAYDAKPSDSPYGTFDMGGNVQEWNEAVLYGVRGLRGGWFSSKSSLFLHAAGVPHIIPPSNEYDSMGFRVAKVFQSWPALLYVDDTAAAANNGSSWCDAFSYLQDALAAAAASGGTVNEIRVAQGTYTPDQGVRQIPGDRAATFQLINSVMVKGGYAGYAEPDPDARDIDAFETVLSGDLNGDDGLDLANNEENSYHIVTGSGTDTTAVLDGVTIAGGHANNGQDAEDHWGGGILNRRGSPTVANCTFRGNTANPGGAMYNAESSPVVSNCTFIHNRAQSGGAIQNAIESNPIISNCVFRGNVATSHGGAMYNYYSSPVIDSCLFSGNTTNGKGGGIYNNRECDCLLTDSVFANNSAAEGGGVYNYRSSPTVHSCRFNGNSSEIGGGMANYNLSDPAIISSEFSGNRAVTGGGLHCSGWSNATLRNCTFAQNSATNGRGIACDSGQGPPSGAILTSCILWDGGEEVWNDGASVITITYTNIQGGWSGKGDDNISRDPLFVALGWWDDAGTPDATEDDTWVTGDYRLQRGSSNIDAGDPGATPAIGETDVGGYPRVLCDRVDMGAHEFGIGDYDCDQAIDLVDWSSWSTCFTGPDGGPYDNGCEAFDFDFDQAVDLFDFAGFQEACTGPLAPTVVIDTVLVGNPGNAGELSGYGAGGYGPDRICGAVDSEYNIGKYEVTAGQYTEFLNAVAATDPYGLYNTYMWSWTYGCKIERSGESPDYSYSVAGDWADRPVNYVSWGDAARFANWLHNGQPTGAQDLSTTEDGSYYLNGATTNGELMAIVRELDATWVIPSEDEWYKAAYHHNDGVTGNYWDYPTSNDSEPGYVNNGGNLSGTGDPFVEGGTDPGNYATYGGDGGTDGIGSPYYRTEVGEWENSDSPYETFDQGGNVWEWNEAVIGSYRGLRGGSFDFEGIFLRASDRDGYGLPSIEDFIFGFRVAEVP